MFRDPGQHDAERPGRLADLDQLAIQRAELRWIACERIGKAPAADDFTGESRGDARHAVARAGAGEHLERRRKRQAGLQQTCELAREARDVACGRRGRTGRPAAVERQYRDAVACERGARGRGVEGDDDPAARRAVAMAAAPCKAGFARWRAHTYAHAAGVAATASAMLVVPSRTRANAASRRLRTPSAATHCASSPTLARATMRSASAGDTGIV